MQTDEILQQDARMTISVRSIDVRKDKKGERAIARVLNNGLTVPQVIFAVSAVRIIAQGFQEKMGC
jgi:hypothetical protein